jgi:hypothetical protein
MFTGNQFVTIDKPRGAVRLALVAPRLAANRRIHISSVALRIALIHAMR